MNTYLYIANQLKRIEVPPSKRKVSSLLASATYKLESG